MRLCIVCDDCVVLHCLCILRVLGFGVCFGVGVGVLLVTMNGVALFFFLFCVCVFAELYSCVLCMMLRVVLSGCVRMCLFVLLAHVCLCGICACVCLCVMHCVTLCGLICWCFIRVRVLYRMMLTCALHVCAFCV